MPRQEFMRLAIEKARVGVGEGQWPFGACLVKDDEVVSCLHNSTRANMDPSAHAEMQALRESCAKLRNVDLAGCELYTTCEPCPMCFYACHSARVSTIVYGASLEDFSNPDRSGRIITAFEMKELLASPIQIVGGFLREEALQLLNP